MNTEDLARFVAVVEAGSFSRAASALGKSQPALSRCIQRVEQEVGARVFERRATRLELTPSGHALYRFAQDTLSGLQRVRSEIRVASAPLAGELRIAAGTTPGEYILPDLLADFVEKWPKVHPKLFVADSEAVVREVAEGAWELGFVGARYPARRLLFETFVDDEVVLAVPKTHPAARAETIDVAHLAGIPFVERAEGSGTIKTVRELLRAHDLKLPAHPVVMILNNTQALLSAVAHGHGLAWISARAIDSVRTPEIRAVRVAGVRLERSLYTVRRRAAPLSPQAEAFLELVRALDPGSVSGRAAE